MLFNKMCNWRPATQEQATYRVNIMNPKYFIKLKQPDLNVFQRFSIPLKLIILIKTAKERHSVIHNVSFGTFEANIGRLYS